MSRFGYLLMLVIAFILLLCACAPAVTPEAPEIKSPTKAVLPTEEVVVTESAAAADGKTLLSDRCTGCHSLDRVMRKKASADEWQALVKKMEGKGATLSDAESEVLVQYLAKTYPK